MPVCDHTDVYPSADSGWLSRAAPRGRISSNNLAWGTCNPSLRSYPSLSVSNHEHVLIPHTHSLLDDVKVRVPVEARSSVPRTIAARCCVDPWHGADSTNALHRRQQPLSRPHAFASRNALSSPKLSAAQPVGWAASPPTKNEQGMPDHMQLTAQPGVHAGVQHQCKLNRSC